MTRTATFHKKQSITVPGSFMQMDTKK